MGKIKLNIFTNCTVWAPGVDCIMQTYESFKYIFDNYAQIPVSVYLDKHPHEENYEQYKKNLERHFDEVITTKSLSDGYIKSIKESRHKYLFQLEHDWVFNDNIKHSLDELLDFMDDLDIYNFRFNKRSNIIAVRDKEMVQFEYRNLKCCISNNMSNNPHIINRKKYKDEIMQHIQIKPGSLGIELELTNLDKYKSVLYGEAGYPATIRHLDGKR